MFQAVGTVTSSVRPSIRPPVHPSIVLPHRLGERTSSTYAARVFYRKGFLPQWCSTAMVFYRNCVLPLGVFQRFLCSTTSVVLLQRLCCSTLSCFRCFCPALRQFTLQRCYCFSSLLLHSCIAFVGLGFRAALPVWSSISVLCSVIAFYELATRPFSSQASMSRHVIKRYARLKNYA